MAYSEELTEELLRDAETLNSELSLRFVRLGSAVSKFKVPRAREYLLQGICRRIDTLRRCMIGVFNTFPVDQEVPLEDEERFLVEVYLQAFLINLFGVFDNVAWTLLYEKGITFDDKGQKGMRRRDVGLFLAATQAHL